MKKSIMCTLGLAAAAALLCVACNDSGTNTSAGNDGRVDDFLSGFKGKGKDTANTPGGITSTYYTLTVDIYPENSGTVSRKPDNATYKAGDTVTVTAAAKTGYTFASWSGMSNATTESVTLVMNGNLSLTANFNESGAVETDTVLPVIALNAPLPPNEAIKGISFTDPGASAHDGRGNTINYDTQIKTAAGQTLTSVNTSAAGTFSITYTACKTLRYADGKTAEKCASAVREVRVIEPPDVLPTYALETGAEPSEGGSVARSPNKPVYTVGDTVTVTAEASANYTFTGWRGASQSTDASVKIVMSGPLTLTANFKKLAYKLEVSAATGGYTLLSSNETDYAPGEEVTVTAKANAGYEFTGWSGAVTSTDTAVTVRMDGNVKLTAAFRQLKYTLDVSAEPAAGGSVSLAPSKDEYTHGEEVTISAKAETGFQFSGWTGSTSTSPTITVTMDGSMTLAAKFEAQTETATTYTLSTVASPSNGGEVTRDPNKTAYPAGEQVKVTATTKPGYTFTGWQGASTATTPTITVTMNSALSLTAGFKQQIYSLTVNVNPLAGGTVTRNDPNKTEYAYGDTVKLTATANTSNTVMYTFKNWTGAVSSTANNVTVIMTENKTLTANFTYTFIATITFNPNGGTVSPTSGTAGTDSKLTSLPTPTRSGYTFNGWYTSASGGTKVDVNRVYNNGNTIIYAQWTAESPLSGNTFTDSRDNKSYKWVEIGRQKWMAENLNYDVPDNTTDLCYGNSAAHCAEYGRLYNWDAAMTACPTEWRLPSDAEWTTLVDYVGEQAGKKLKSVSGWNSNYSTGEFGNGTDEYGFSALPGGYWANAGGFASAAYDGRWWSSTESSASDVWSRYMWFNDDDVISTDFNDKTLYRYSVRCIKDE